MFRRLPDAVRDQRVVLAQERADDEHAVELAELGELQAEPRRALQLAVASEVRLAQAEVDVLAAERPDELLREEHLLERRVRRHERADRGRAVRRLDLAELRRHEVERLLPVDLPPLAA